MEQMQNTKLQLNQNEIVSTFKDILKSLSDKEKLVIEKRI